MYMKIFMSFVCGYVYKYMQYSERPEEGIGLTVCELLHGCWEQSLGLLRQQPVHLTAEPSLQFVLNYF